MKYIAFLIKKKLEQGISNGFFLLHSNRFSKDGKDVDFMQRVNSFHLKCYFLIQARRT